MRQAAHGFYSFVLLLLLTFNLLAIWIGYVRIYVRVYVCVLAANQVSL